LAKLVLKMEGPKERYANMPARYNGAPSQDILVIRQNHETRERTLDPLKWGLIPYWCKDPKGRTQAGCALQAAGAIYLRRRMEVTSPRWPSPESA
jgi:putative SOS response-associated peptidase YedK